jgi:hypothetical protein
LSNKKGVNPVTHPDESVYLEHAETRKFFEVSHADNRLIVRRGEVGKACLVYKVSYKIAGKSQENFERLVQAWSERQFVEVSPSKPIIEGSHAGELICKEIESHPTYGQFFEIGWADELRGQSRRIMHFAHGLMYDGDFDLEEVADMGLCAGLIIEGDVHVSGVFSQMANTYPGSTLITGNVHAHSLMHGDGHMRICGDVRLENTIYGEYNDGCLEIYGGAFGKLMISNDHDMHAQKEGDIYDLDDGETEGLVAELLDEDGDVNWEKLSDWLLQRKSPLHPDFIYTPPLPPTPLPEPEVSLLFQQVRALAIASDVEGLTALLETWPERTVEWRDFVKQRLLAPSTTDEQRKRLKAVL